MKGKMKARRWANKMGWDVPTRYGLAEVRNLVTKLRVFVPVSARWEWSERRQKWIKIPRYRFFDVAPGTDPVEAVMTCQQRGEVKEEC